MRINIKGATPQNIVTTIQGIMDQFQVDMYEANIDINFSKNGVPVVFVDEEDYEEILVSRELNPQKEYPKMKLNFGKFISEIEQKEYLLEEENKRHLRFKEIERIEKIGYLAICKINDSFKIFPTSKEPDKSFFNKKEKEGYKISLLIKHDNNREFLDNLKLKFKEESKEIEKGSYPLFKLNPDDLEFIKSQSEVIFSFDNSLIEKENL